MNHPPSASTSASTLQPNRRQFLAGITASMAVQGGLMAADAPAAWPASWQPLLGWQDDRLQLLVGRSEIGQGILTALCQLVASELELPLSRIDAQYARFDPRWPGQGTSASVSIHTEFRRYRDVAAALGAWLLDRAAARWCCDPARLRLQEGQVVLDGGTQTVPFGDLLADAGTTPAALPGAPPRPWPGPEAWQSPPRVEGPCKVDGSARFGADVRLPGLLFADWWSAPAGDEVIEARLPETPAGVHPPEVFADGVSVLGTSTWAVRQGMQRLQVRTRRVDPAPRDDAEVDRALRAALAGPLQVLTPTKAGTRRAAALGVHADYRLPFLAHAPMEPVTATARVGRDQVELWLSTQHPERARQAVAQALGRPAEAVQITRTLVGGGFGIKTYPDAAVRAARLAARTGRPVQLSLSRESDFAADYFRPASLHRLAAGLDADGRVQRWRHDAAAASVMAWYPGADLSDPSTIDADALSFAGCDHETYDIADFQARGRGIRTAIRCGIWRSIGHFASTFASECFIDELAHRAGRDPLAFRLDHLAHAPRTRAVLERVAEAAGWRGRREGRHRAGAALYREFHPPADDGGPGYEVIVAHVARLAPHAGGWRLQRLHVAVDAGQIVHPGHVRAQMEGGAAWALSALTQRVRFTQGRCEARNFADFTPLRLPAMPEVDVHIVPSGAWPAGVGEKGVPGVAPAVLNAWFAATGQRVRQLPWAGNPLHL